MREKWSKVKGPKPPNNMAVCFTERELIQKASQTDKQHSWLNDTVKNNDK